MREIKFRAKDGHGVWRVIDLTGSMAWSKDLLKLIARDQKFFKFVTPLCQFTGLKDKNGKEIWEGDILSDKTPPRPGHQTVFGVVEVKFGEYDDSSIDYGSSGIGWYVQGYHGYVRSDGRQDFYNIGNGEPEWSLDCVTSWEVIGNIHDKSQEEKMS